MHKYQQIKPGDIIVSSPYTDAGIIFNKSVIYIISYSETNVSGVIINKLLSQVDNKTVSKALHIESRDKSSNTSPIDVNIPVYFGGPVEQGKGVILHSSDYREGSVNSINESISISTDIKILSDIASNKGPTHKMLILGYASWSPDQLLSEIKRNDWILLLNQPNLNNFYDLIFMEDCNFKWKKALELAKIDLSHYSNLIGNA